MPDPRQGFHFDHNKQITNGLIHSLDLSLWLTFIRPLDAFISFIKGLDSVIPFPLACNQKFSRRFFFFFWSGGGGRAYPSGNIICEFGMSFNLWPLLAVGLFITPLRGWFLEFVTLDITTRTSINNTTTNTTTTTTCTTANLTNSTDTIPGLVSLPKLSLSSLAIHP